MSNMKNKQLTQLGLIDILRDYQIWCGFDEFKHPYGLDGVKGIGVDTPRDRLGTYEQAKALGYPYVGISLTEPIKINNKLLLCIDFDWKKSPSRTPEPGQSDLISDLEGLGAAMETSLSGFGAHGWILADEDKIPARLKLQNECEIEVFSGMPGQVANVLVTDFDATGSLLSVDLTTRLPGRVAVNGLIGNKPANAKQTDHGRAELIRALDYISPNDYSIWLQIGMALKYELGDAGFDSWDQWSSKDDKYDPSEMAYKWNSFHGGGVTAGTLIRYAQEGGFIYRRETESANDAFNVYVDPKTGEINEGAAQKTNPWSLRVVAPTDHVVATDWLIDGVISEKLSLIAGAPGIGKSTCLFGTFATVAGFKDIDSPLIATFRRKILWVSEHPEQIQQLMEGIYRKYVDAEGSPLYTKEEINEWIAVVEAFRASSKELKSLAEFAIDYVVYDEDGNPVEPLIVLDTASACLDLEDENNNSEVGKYVSAIKESLIRNHFPVVLIAHTPKAVHRREFTALTARGAGAFEGDAHATGFVFHDADIDRIVFKLGKRRYKATIDEIIFQSQSLLTNAIDRRGRSVLAEFTIALPRISSEISRAEMAVKVSQQKLRESEVAKVQDKYDKSMMLWKWLFNQGQVSVNQIQGAKLVGLTDKKLIKEVLGLMLDDDMVTKAMGLRGGQNTALYVANKEWSCHKRSA